jgi:site-specific DNA-cytosine methylase
VRAKVLDAQWLGVPQRRKRVIIIGIRDDLDAEPAFPTPLPFRYSMLDACPWLGGFDALTDDSFDGEAQSIDEPAPTVTTQAARGVGHPRWQLIGGFGFDPDHAGVELDEPSPTIPAADSHRNRWQLRHNHTTGMKHARADLDEPAVTITASDAGNVALVREGVEYRGGTNRSASGRVDPLDEPMGTITGQGALGMKHSEISVHLRHWGASGRAEVREPLDNVAPTITDHPSRTVLRYDDHNFHRGHVDDLDDPASTIAASGIRGVGMTQAVLDDGTEQRKLSIAEVKRLCSFPDDYELVGNYAAQWARLGNSVPPLMMAAVARALAPILAVPADQE